MYYSHILDLNMNEWVSLRGRIKVVPSNLVSTSSWYQDLGARKLKIEIP